MTAEAGSEVPAGGGRTLTRGEDWYSRGVDDAGTPTGPMPERQPDPGTPAEIEQLLQRVPHNEECQHRAFALLQRYRGECFAAIARCADTVARQEAVELARAALRQRLLDLVAECGRHVSPAEAEERTALRSRLVDPDLVRMEGEYRAECEREVAEAEQLFQTTYAGLLEHEKRLNMLDGMSAPVAEAAARANLVLRLQGLEEELRGIVAHHRERYRRRLVELAAMQDDRRAEGC